MIEFLKYMLLISMSGILVALLSDKKDSISKYTSVLMLIAVLTAGLIGMLTYFEQAKIELGWRIGGIVGFIVVILTGYYAIKRHDKQERASKYYVNGSYGLNEKKNRNIVRKKGFWNFWKADGYRYYD